MITYRNDWQSLSLSALFQVLVFFVVFGATASPQGYNLRPPSGPSLLSRRCSAGQVLHVDGRCVSPRVNHRVFVYDIPSTPKVTGPPPYIPKPVVETFHLFIRIPEGVQDPDPIIVPPPKQEHIVYVLNKQLEQSQKVIQVPASPTSDPEVYFVNYAEGENPVLPIGVDLETALTAADQGNGQSSVGDSSIGGTQESTGAFGVSGNFRGIFGLGRTADSRTTFGLGDVSNSVTNTGLGNGIDSSTNGGLGVGGTANGNAGLGSSVISRTDGGIGAVDNFGNNVGVESIADFSINDGLEGVGIFTSNADVGSNVDSNRNGGLGTGFEINSSNFVSNNVFQNGGTGSSNNFGNTNDLLNIADFQTTANFLNSDGKSVAGVQNNGDIEGSVGFSNGGDFSDSESDILGKDLGFISVASDNGSSGSRTRSNSINDIINTPGASILSSLSGLYAVP